MKLPIVSGRDTAKALSKLGFRAIDQKGSHLIMVGYKAGVKRKVVVPQHPEIAKGTLLSIFKQAGVTREEFYRALK